MSPWMLITTPLIVVAVLWLPKLSISMAFSGGKTSKKGAEVHGAAGFLCFNVKTMSKKPAVG